VAGAVRDELSLSLFRIVDEIASFIWEVCLTGTATAYTVPLRA
jgi:hypothetical protein